MRTREEHLALCKTRAIAYIERGMLCDAMTSMLSDLTKHPETKRIADADTSAGRALFSLALLYERNGDREAMRRWVEGFT
jgi:hypothetical protein